MYRRELTCVRRVFRPGKPLFNFEDRRVIKAEVYYSEYYVMALRILPSELISPLDSLLLLPPLVIVFLLPSIQVSLNSSTGSTGKMKHRYICIGVIMNWILQRQRETFQPRPFTEWRPIALSFLIIGSIRGNMFFWGRFTSFGLTDSLNLSSSASLCISSDKRSFVGLVCLLSGSR